MIRNWEKMANAIHVLRIPKPHKMVLNVYLKVVTSYNIYTQMEHVEIVHFIQDKLKIKNHVNLMYVLVERGFSKMELAKNALSIPRSFRFNLIVTQP